MARKVDVIRLLEELDEALRQEPQELTGGIIHCDCICHHPIGTIRVGDFPQGCIHCRLIA